MEKPIIGKYYGDTTLSELPSGSKIEVIGGTLTVNCRMGQDVTIKQTGPGDVIVNAATNWNAKITADGNIKAVSAVFKSVLNSGKDITLEYDACQSAELYAPDGKVKIRDADNNTTIKAKEIEITGNVGKQAEIQGGTINIGGAIDDNAHIQETGKDRVLPHTLHVHRPMGKNVTINQKGKGNVEVHCATNWEADISSEGNISVVSAVYKTKLTAGGDITVRYNVCNGAELRARKGSVSIGGEVGENTLIAAQTIHFAPGKKIDASAKITETGDHGSFVSRIQKVASNIRSR